MHLNAELRGHPHRPPDELLRWHLRQTVLANMRGAGEPLFDAYYGHNVDALRVVSDGPRPVEHIEFELFSRLGE